LFVPVIDSFGVASRELVMAPRQYSRRRLLGSTGGALAGLAGGLTKPRLVFAQNKTPIKFTLPWVPEGSDLFAFTAKGMGFWDKHRP
jgi:hypothetical protein